MSDTSPRGIVDRVLSFIDKPWKAIVVIVLVIICGAGYLIYLERTEIAQALLSGKKPRPHLDIAAFDDDAHRLMHEIAADVALLMEVKLSDNIAITRAGVAREGKVELLEGQNQAISATLNVKLLIRFLNNSVACTTIHEDNANAQVVALVRFGITYSCVVEVPPVYGIMVGALLVGWKQEPSKDTLDRVTYLLPQAATKYAVW